MPLTFENKRYYQTTEACVMAGISRNTFLRWVREGIFTDVAYRDRNGWRLFTEEDLIRLKTKAHRIIKASNAR